MRFLLINNEFPPIGGGGSTVTKHAAAYLVQAGHRVTLVTSRYGSLPHKEMVDGAAVIRIPTIRRYADYCSMWELIIFGFSAAWYCFFYTLRHSVDFTQAYFALPAGFTAWFLNITRGIPYAVYFGGSDIPGANPSRYKKIYPFITPVLKMIWRRAEFRTVCSKELALLAKKTDPRFDFRVIPNGVDTKRFKPADREDNNKVKILFIGRLIRRKGLHRVIKALPKVKEKLTTPFELEVVGTGSSQKELEALSQKLGVKKLVRFVGNAPYDQLEKIYQGADIFVLTSLSEGMPAVILEAMGCGLAVVASDVGGNNEIVEEEVNGYLIAGSDIDLLAKRLASLIENRELRKKMGEESRRMALRYDWDNIMKEYEEMYLQIKK